ncbi:hypothetical protein IE4872_PC00135 (plasmid) [Rhizobium gallicum]|uniref:Uncharacterized protein n=1 Tax=Rhizobium gallicum TaxID=56730 RepID=A0A1L5NQI6_9HYPH|nr:hypothetical protein IE4872_PC00135 [Rhizobium gallicum]
MTLETISQMSDDPLISLPAVARWSAGAFRRRARRPNAMPNAHATYRFRPTAIVFIRGFSWHE